jgi:hypothetical protein
LTPTTASQFESFELDDPVRPAGVIGPMLPVMFTNRASASPRCRAPLLMSVRRPAAASWRRA